MGLSTVLHWPGVLLQAQRTGLRSIPSLPHTQISLPRSVAEQVESVQHHLRPVESDRPHRWSTVGWGQAADDDHRASGPLAANRKRKSSLAVKAAPAPATTGNKEDLTHPSDVEPISRNAFLCGKSGNTTPSAAGPALVSPHASQPESQEARGDERSSPLPPSRGGLSPTKHSTPLLQNHVSRSNGDHSDSGNAGELPLVATTPKPAVLPPIAALSPSPRQQVLTPPIKPSEPVRGSQELPRDAKPQTHLQPASS